MAQHFIKTRIIKIAAVCCALFVMAKTVSAQQLSTYEQKRYDLAKETIYQMGDRLGDDRDALSLGLGLYMLGETIVNGDFESKLQEMYFWEELIESIVTASPSLWGDDFGQSYANMNALKEVYRSWKDKRKVLDQTRTKADIDREHQFMPTDGTIDKMISRVRIEFGRWAKRGKYEKTVDYQNRLNTQGIAVFDGICDAIITEGKICMTSPASEVINEHYDPDKEQYLATIIYGDDSYKGKLSLVCPVSPDLARWYRFGTITKICVDGKWLVPAESESYERVHLKTTFTTTAKTTPLRICFKDIKFGYTEISDELKNHCFSIDEYNAKLRVYYDSLYNYKEDLRKRWDKLESDYSKLNIEDKEDFQKWWKSRQCPEDFYEKRRTAGYYDRGFEAFSYNDVDILLNNGYSEKKKSYKELQEYKEILAEVQTRLNTAEQRFSKELAAAEKEKSRKLAEEATTQFLSKVFEEYGNKPKIKKISIESNKVTFYVPKKGQLQGDFIKKTLNNSDGELYYGYYYNSRYWGRLPLIRCTENDNLILYIGRHTEENAILIVNKKDIYQLSQKIKEQLWQHFYFQ